VSTTKQPSALIKTEALYTALFVVGLIAPFAVYPTFLMKLFCFALFASAFNLLLGFAGLLSFGHAAFLGTAGYVCGLMVRDMGVTPEVGIIAGTAAAGLLGWLFGVLAIRRTGIYFAMITLALAQMVYFIVLQVKATGGEDGLQGVPAATSSAWWTCPTTLPCTTWSTPCSALASSSSTGPSTHPLARFSRRSAKTSQGRYPWVTT
jgi:branched-chain amino acid transport system permease protein